MQVSVDQEQCSGCGLCREICPQVFGLKSEEQRDIAYVKIHEIPEVCEALCLDAADRCPVDAILVKADRTGLQPGRGA